MLVDALRPPPGHTLATAVGTTFTLDVNALLLATLSFAVVDRLETDNGQPDPISLLESVRRHADNITVFAQAGAMSGPRNHPPILSYLEDSVVPVRPGRPGHLFHPKVWALKFVDDAGVASYRLLVLSRNLTFDASWDTIVRLDSSPNKDPRKQHGAVADFLEMLPRIAVDPMDPQRSAGVIALANELRNVGWENPEGARSIWFHPMGTGYSPPKIQGDRILVISPFLTEPAIRSLGESPGDNICISRPAALDGVGAAAVVGFAETLVVDTMEDVSNAAVVDDADQSVEIGIDIEPPRPGSELAGLHAKVYVTENDDYNRLWIGSANATGPAFAGNEEFMVECCFRHADLNIDMVLDGGPATLRSMLVPYEPVNEKPAEPTELEAETLKLDALVRDLATGSFGVHVTTGEIDGSWAIELQWPPLSDSQRQLVADLGVQLAIGPATQAGNRVAWANQGARIDTATLEAVTSFLTIEASTRIDGQNVVARSLVNARLTGAPADRDEQLLARLLDDPEKVLRYLLFLLAELTGDSSLLDAFGGSGASFDWAGGSDNAPPILESLLKALVHAPESLDRVAEFITDLRSGPAGEHLPQGFDEIWGPISEVREAQR